MTFEAQRAPCPVCGTAHATCTGETGPPMGLVDLPRRGAGRANRAGYRSRERVYGSAPDGSGRQILLYPVGAAIPEEEARRQGLVVDEEPVAEQEGGAGDEEPDAEGNGEEEGAVEGKAADAGADGKAVAKEETQDKAIKGPEADKQQGRRRRRPPTEEA